MSASPLPAPSTSRPAAPAAPSTAQVLRERIARGLEAAARLHSPGAAAVLKRARVARTETRATKIVAEAEAMLALCESRPLPTSRPAPAPRAPRRPEPPPACFGEGSPKTEGRRAAQLAKKRARTDKLNPLAAARSCGGGGNKKKEGKKGK